MKSTLFMNEYKSFMVTCMLTLESGRALNYSFSNVITPLFAKALLFMIKYFEGIFCPSTKSMVADAYCSSL